MTYLFAILSTSIMYMIFLSSSLEMKQTKICVNCQHFIQPKNGLKDEFGKCSKLPYASSKFLVDGIVRDDEFYSCSTARSCNLLCGKDAKEYRKKYTKKTTK
jgi:hypothetical protein